MNKAFYLERDSTDNEREVIFHTGSDLEVKVYHLDEDSFDLRFERTTFYGEGDGCNLAFQLASNNRNQYYLALYAISWYATSIGKPKMIIIEKDNRLAS